MSRSRPLRSEALTSRRKSACRRHAPGSTLGVGICPTYKKQRSDFGLIADTVLPLFCRFIPRNNLNHRFTGFRHLDAKLSAIGMNIRLFRASVQVNAIHAVGLQRDCRCCVGSWRRYSIADTTVRPCNDRCPGRFHRYVPKFAWIRCGITRLPLGNE